MGVSITGGIKTINDIKAGLFQKNIFAPASEDVVLIINGDGAEDEYATPTVDSTVLDSETVKSGSYSKAFSSARWIEYPKDTSFDFGTDDFTIEAWFNINAYSSSVATTLFDFRDDRAVEQRLSFFFNRTDENVQTYISGATYATQDIDLTLHQWNHIAAVMHDGSLTVYVNGIGGTPVTQPLSLLSSKMRIGQPAGSELVVNAFNGYMDNIRITKGFAVYRGDFTPPNSL